MYNWDWWTIYEQMVTMMMIPIVRIGALPWNGPTPQSPLLHHCTAILHNGANVQCNQLYCTRNFISTLESTVLHTSGLLCAFLTALYITVVLTIPDICHIFTRTHFDHENYDKIAPRQNSVNHHRTHISN